jgi:hypothetical protein
MPRKPSSIWVIVEPANQGGTMVSGFTVKRIELLNREPEVAAEQFLQTAPLGATVHFIEDTKVKTFRVNVSLEEVDDARIGHDQDDADTSVS